MEINVNGDIIPNDDKWIYDWLKWDCTCPADIRGALEEKPKGEKLTILINSGGGAVMAGQEIYSILRGRDDVEIVIQSIAGSAASVIAMAAPSKISPVGLIMIHNVAMHGASGDYHEMEKNAEILRAMNEALAQSYIAKTGKSEDEVLRLMDEEAWITANQAVEMGFADAILTDGTPVLTNSTAGMRLTEEIRQKVIAEKAAADRIEAEKKELLQDLDAYG